jgi:hypothetical protein
MQVRAYDEMLVNDVRERHCGVLVFCYALLRDGSGRRSS